MWNIYLCDEVSANGEAEEKVTFPLTEVIKIFDNPKIKNSPSFPKAFTEKG